tara:strand:- start:566 stop:727 length:162 start_codon:yes stop_codon:yes gene_type:complete
MPSRSLKDRPADRGTGNKVRCVSNVKTFSKGNRTLVGKPKGISHSNTKKGRGY